MTLYVIRSATFGSLVEATTCADTANIWREHNTWAIEAQPSISDEELNVVTDISQWLLENYNNGAHWIYETTDTAHHVAALRHFDGDVSKYRASLKRQWEVTEDYAEDIRNA